MKFSSWLALSGLAGRHLSPCKKGWKDAALAAIVVKNEILGKDGVVRKYVENGATDGEIAETQQALDDELAKQKANSQPPQNRRQAFWGGFKKAFQS
jgi:hypothetical protein